MFCCFHPARRSGEGGPPCASRGWKGRGRQRLLRRSRMPNCRRFVFSRKLFRHGRVESRANLAFSRLVAGSNSAGKPHHIDIILFSKTADRTRKLTHGIFSSIGCRTDQLHPPADVSQEAVILPDYVFTIRSEGQMVERARVVACDNDDAALGYACSMVRRLRTVGGYNDPNLMVRVFDDRRPLVFCLPFLPARA
jgi:hypothetical protein